MIPKIIHCCWFGGPKTKLAEKCRASWRRFAPDWEIREWGAEDLLSLRHLPGYGFFLKAHNSRKWSMASDWVRMAVLYHQGGVYLDFDHELVAPIDRLSESEWVAGEWRVDGSIQYAAGAGLALTPRSPLARFMLEKYECVPFDPDRDMMPWIVGQMEEAFQRLGRIRVLSPEMMSPIDVHGVCHRTEKTLGIHHYAMSWATPGRRIAKWLAWHRMRWLVELALKVKG